MGAAELTAWLERETGGFVDSIEPMAGSSSTSIFRGLFSGTHPDVVVKVYDKPELADEAEDFVRREARALDVARVVALRTPELVAADPHGTEIGVPVVAMTALPGRPHPRPGPDPDAWIEGMAEVVRVIDDAPVPTDDLPRYVEWNPGPVEIPPWADDPGPWRAMNEILGQELPAAPWRFIHRDLHVLNILWDRGQVSGVVDWPNACVGPVEADLARSRVNIAMVDDPEHPLDLADRFTQRCGFPYDHRWDLTIAAGFLPIGEVILLGNAFGADVTGEGIRAAIEAVVRAAVS